MAIFEWDEKLSTGIPLIDEQHKKLVSFVNELHDAMRQRKAKEVLGKILGELKQYTVYHFSTEERAFEKFGYERAGEHAAAHAALIRKLDELVGKYERGEIAISIDILDFLIDWVRTHIMKEDQLYVPLLRGKELV